MASSTSSRAAADLHDLIRLQGARENNLKDVTLEIPKRRLTVFTGVSGSGKSSPVFGTIAAESQRLINETCSALVQVGPGAGHDGGKVVFEGTPAELVAKKSTLTGQHLAACVAGGRAPRRAHRKETA